MKHNFLTQTRNALTSLFNIPVLQTQLLFNESLPKDFSRYWYKQQYITITEVASFYFPSAETYSTNHETHFR